MNRKRDDRMNAPLEEFKYETHLHTKETSACAKNTARQMVRAYKEAGYQGIIVTDHFFNGNTTVPARLPWEERVRLFCLGYENAKEEGSILGLDVFFGWEYGYHHTDLLTYGLDKEFLLAHPDLLSLDLPTYVRLVRENGGFITHAHPFREAFYILHQRFYPDLVDAVEVINGSHTNPEFDRKAAEYAAMHGLIPVSGTDAHSISPERFAGIKATRRLNSCLDFISLLRSREDYSLLGKPV